MDVEGTEKKLADGEVIVSKTDLRGNITYANDVLLDISEYRLRDLIGKPHSILRSRGMPRAAFKLVWDHLTAGREVFAYVVNRTRLGNHYWVFAHMTPTTNAAGEIIGYHSNRRQPADKAVSEISKIYDSLLAEEARHRNGKESLAASSAASQSDHQEHRSGL